MHYTTRSTTYCPLDTAARDHFAVAEGIPLEAALQKSGELLEAATDIARRVAGRISRPDGSAELWGAIHLIETAAALMEAIQAGIFASELQNEAANCEVFPLALTADEVAAIRRLIGSTDADAVESWANSVVQARLRDLSASVFCHRPESGGAQ